MGKSRGQCGPSGNWLAQWTVCPLAAGVPSHISFLSSPSTRPVSFDWASSAVEECHSPQGLYHVLGSSHSALENLHLWAESLCVSTICNSCSSRETPETAANDQCPPEGPFCCWNGPYWYRIKIPAYSGSSWMVLNHRHVEPSSLGM